MLNDDWISKVPENVIPNAVIHVVSYLDEDGEMKFMVWFDGDIPLSSCLGLLELAKHDLIERCD